MRNWMTGLLLATAATAVYAEPLNYNVVNLEASASREVSNDTAYATLFVEMTDSNPSRLAELVNTTLAAALKTVKQEPAVQSAGTGYSTYPVYGKTNKQDGWRGRGELRLTSKDFPALSKLLGQLQQPQANGQSLQLAEVRYGVSERQRELVENELIQESLKAFRQRATLIGEGLSGKSWKIVNLNVHAGQPMPPPRPVLYKAAVMSASADAAPAPLEGGESRVSVSVAGSVQIVE
ncbi:SIMPL domain-containing protein [Andreprevotia chitinilytica]|uniref:SIMPL domain-containing protein n=1 Tax=Andreprevotia chitinilytica TaxID=396808 RepID=UPI0005517E49|nr:SIMPL domain-containing protein [Andreprevotia chitinilytica]